MCKPPEEIVGLSDADFTETELDRIYGTQHKPDLTGISNNDCRIVFGMNKRQMLQKSNT